MKPADYARYLRRYLRPQWRRVAALAVLLVGGLAVQLVNPQIIRYFLDTVQSGGSQQLLAAAAFAFVGVALLQQVISLGAIYAGERVGWDATDSLRHDLVLHLLRLDLPFHKAHTPGELLERIDGDAGAVSGFFSQFAVQAVSSSLLGVGVLVVPYVTSWQVGLGLPAYVVFTPWILTARP